MSSKWFWKPVIVGAVIVVMLYCLLIASLGVVLSGGRYSADSFIKDLVGLGLQWLALGALIGAGLGALLAVIRKRIRGTGEEARPFE